MFCMNCGQQLPDGAKFCLECGTPQGAIAPTNSVNAGPKFVPAMCPNCNARLNVDPSYQIARCGSCGTECLVQDAINKLSISGSVNLVHSGNVVHSGTVTYKKDYTNEPNLFVSYASADPTLGMTMKIPRLNITSVFNSGMEQSFKVAPGRYVMKIKFGTLTRVNINAERYFDIYDDGTPTRINIGWQGGLFSKYYINVN